jgi:hypothetical protein
MSLTLDELKEKLTERYDPDMLIEVLKLSSDELVEAFEFRILEMFDKLEEEFEDEDGEWNHRWSATDYESWNVEDE